MKKTNILTLLLILLFGSHLGYAQPAAGGQVVFNGMNSGPRVQSTLCGLDYVMESIPLNQRQSSGPLGLTQPTFSDFNIAIPSGTNLVEAHIWFTIVGQEGPVPTIYPFTFDGNSLKANLVGEFFDVLNSSGGNIINGATCWNADNLTTATYHATVTSIVNSNLSGPYNINNLDVLNPSGGNVLNGQADTDGATLLIVYEDPTDFELNSLTVWDGAAYVAGGSSTFVMQGPSVAIAQNNGTDRAFAVVGDGELNSSFNNNVTFPGQATSQNIPGNMWDQVEDNMLSLQLGQSSYSYTVQPDPNGNDCLMTALLGVYSHGNNSTNCAVPLNGYVTGNNPLCPGDCAVVSAIAYGGTPPYTYQWNGPGVTGSTTNPFATICPSNGMSHSVTISDALLNQITINVSMPIMIPLYIGQGDLQCYTQAGPGPNFCEGWGPTIVFDLAISYPNAALYEWTLPDGTVLTSTTSSQITVPNVLASAGQYCLRVQNVWECWSNTACHTITIDPAPVFPDIYMCEGDDPIILGFTSGVGNPAPSTSDYVSLPGGSFSSSGPGLGTFNFGGTHYIFTPPGVGQYVIDYSYTSPAGCQFNVSATIHVLSGPGWPKTSSNTVGGDKAADVDSDSQGNIYVVGDFIEETNFDASFIQAGGGNKGMFLTKYDACGKVVWVAQSWDSEIIQSGGVIVDEANDRVYVTGSYDKTWTIQFASAVGQSCTSPPMNAAANNTMFIAAYSLDGCLIEVENYQDVNGGDYWAKSIGVGAHGVYVCGRVSNGGSSSAFVKRVNKTTLIEDWTMEAASTVPSMSNIGNDIAVGTDSQLGWDNIYLVGNFKNNIDFGSNPITNTVAFMDMFFARIVDNNTGSPVLSWINKLNSQTSSAGYSVSLDDAGEPYYTGHFIGTAITSFDGNHSAVAPQGDAFVMHYDDFSPATGGWFRPMNVIGGGYMVGTGVSVDQSGVYSTGYYRGSSINFASGIISSPASAFQGFVTKHDFSGTNLWGNATMSGGKHRPFGIKANNSGYAYTVGTYKGFMDFYNGTTPSITSTATSGSKFNAFALRTSDASSGDFKNMLALTEKEQVNPLDVRLFPNPNTGEFVIEVPSAFFDKTVTTEVYSYVGRRVHSHTSDGRSNMKIDISDQAPGMYIVKIKIGDQLFTEKIIKE
jgi:hypothetical protein